MLKSLLALSLTTFTLLANMAYIAADETAAATQAEDLIVHEWGTFTSFSGSDGVQLEFRPLVHGELPSFVIDPYYQAYGAFTKSFRSFQRMETPVVYFYTPREMSVDVKVEFPQGLLTEYYPPVSAFSPSIDSRTTIQGMIDAGELSTINWDDPSVGGSSLTWNDVKLIPTSLLRPQLEDKELAEVIQKHAVARLMPDPEGNHYGHARETDAALVLFQPDPQADSEQFPISGIAGIDHFFEKFLFYRGIGNLSLPFEATYTTDDVIRASNSGNEDIASVFLVVSNGTEEGLRFVQHRGLGRGQQIDISVNDVAGSLPELAIALTQVLVEDGLYQREAEAMVATWRDSWFLEPGTRLFYIVPRQTTDELLPLQISPQPAETVRVMVGRMEMMTPSQESEIIGAVSRNATRRLEAQTEAATTGVEAPALPVPAEILALGRWAEPALVRISQISDDTAVRQEAQALIGQLRELALVAVQDVIVPQEFLNLEQISQ
jgi:hypothetical protein